MASSGLSEAPGIGRLLSENSFVVPNHQRDYSWTEDEVIELIGDMTGALNLHNAVYFVGLMVFLGRDQNLVVLDGQQRLATAVIIFSAIRNWLLQYDEFRQDADDIQRDFIGKRKLGGSEIEPKLTMNVANQQVFLDYIIHSRPIEDVETKASQLKRRDKNRLLLNASLSARRWVAGKAEEFSDHARAAQYFFQLVNYMRDSVGTVKMLVSSEEMAYTIFETLNDRGLELSPLDLVKNHLFARAAAHSGQRVKLMETRWTQMVQTLVNVRSDQFLKVFWTSRHGRIRTRNLFDMFKKQYSSNDDANNLSMDMLSAAEQYAALETADDPIWAPHSAETRAFVRTLKVIGSQQAHPVMLAGLSRFDVREMERLLKMLEVVSVRYLHIGGGNPGRFETTCAILARKIYAREVKTATEAFAEISSVYPSDAEFRHLFALKEEENNQNAQYYLRKLEVEAQRVAIGQLPSELEPGTPLTVEHILPRNPGTEWATVLGRDPDIVDDCVFRLGNLCLLTDVNRQLGRKGFSEKQNTFDLSLLITTKEISRAKEWDRMQIEQRQTRMASLAVTIWRFQ